MYLKTLTLFINEFGLYFLACQRNQQPLQLCLTSFFSRSYGDILTRYIARYNE